MEARVQRATNQGITLKCPVLLLPQDLHPVVHFSFGQEGAPPDIPFASTTFQQNCPVPLLSPRRDIHIPRLWNISFWRSICNSYCSLILGFCQGNILAQDSQCSGELALVLLTKPKWSANFPEEVPIEGMCCQ